THWLFFTDFKRFTLHLYFKNSILMKPLNTTVMLILFANYSHAQYSSYEKLWKEVENFENKGLPKSALDVVLQISAKAKKDNNDKQYIKTLIYKSKYALTLEEDAQLSIINEFKSEIAKSESPTKNLLESMLANLYWQYFQQHRWQFYNRTTDRKSTRLNSSHVKISYA